MRYLFSPLYVPIYLLLTMLLATAEPAGAQPSSPLWQPVVAPAARGAATGRWFALDAAQLATRLAAVPLETQPAKAVQLELPYPDGSLHRFALTQVEVLAPALAARYPQIQTYAGHRVDEPTTTVRLETSPAGLHAQVLPLTAPFSVLTEPTAPGRYHSRLDPPSEGSLQCLTLPGAEERLLGGTPPAAPASYGPQRRVLRLAMAATGEYVRNQGGGTVAGALASMATLVNSLNAVYERDMGLRLQLVANNDQVIYLNDATDPYDNSTPLAMLNANQAALDGAIGKSNYDLGHVLGHRSNGYSGVASVGVVCSATSAARGASTGGSARAMAEVVTHEIGHQLGSEHTFNSDQGSCGNNNRSAVRAFELGAGNTIMSYNGRCDSDNVGELVPYFHTGSLSVIVPRLTCGALTATGNRAPTLTVPANTYTIPLGTPFALTGTGADPDGDALSYSWEELDRGDPTGLTGAATDPTGPPLFRSFAPATSPGRTFPKLSAVLSNTPSLGEILPLVERTLNFRLTARDNRGGGAAADVVLTVAAAGPFAVTAPNTAATLASGSTYALSWDVRSTNQAPVNCANVRVLFSTDGGLTFPTVLLASTPNDGAAQVQLPNVGTTQGRFKIQALDNVFFAVNNANLTLGAPLAAGAAGSTSAALQLWPNPARGTVAVAGLAAGQAVQLVDLTGRVLLRAVVPARGPLSLALPRGLAPGLYIVRGAGQFRRLVIE